MKNIIFSRRGRRFIPGILGLFSVLLLIMPSLVYAMTVTVTVDSPTHTVGEEVVVTAVVDGSLWWPGLHFAILDGGPNGPYEGEVQTVRDVNLWVSTFTYVSNGKAGVDTIEVYANYWDGTFQEKGSATVEWVPNTPSAVIITRPKLNVKSHGALSITLCGSGNFDVKSVVADSVKLMGVSPVRQAYEDVLSIDGGPDGFTDLILKFKTKEIVAALGEVEDGDKVDFVLTASLVDETPLEVQFQMEILKKGKCKGKKDRNNKQHHDLGNSNGNGKAIAKGHDK